MWLSKSNSNCPYKSRQKRGRPSLDATNPPPPVGPQRPAHTPRLIADVRFDRIDHLPVFVERQRCKKDGCNARSNVKCEKCQRHLSQQGQKLFCTLPCKEMNTLSHVFYLLLFKKLVFMFIKKILPNVSLIFYSHNILNINGCFDSCKAHWYIYEPHPLVHIWTMSIGTYMNHTHWYFRYVDFRVSW